MKIAVIGSRSFANPDLLARVLSEYTPTEIISGGAKGADSLAADYARCKGISLVEIKPNWKLGRHAGVLRNTEIVNTCDLLVAFWDGESKGTADSIKKAQKLCKAVNVGRY